MKIKPEFTARLRGDPSAQAAVIVTTDGPPAGFADRAEALGLRVHRQFKLRPMLALGGPASAVLTLLEESWVLLVEEDQKMTTMDR